MGRHLAFSHTLYFLFKIHRACVIQNKNHGGFIDHQRKGLGVGEVCLAHLPHLRCHQCFWKEQKERKTSANRLDAFSRCCFSVLWMPIAHVRYVKILTWLPGFLVIFLFLVWFSLLLKSLLGIARQWSFEKFAILTLKPWSFVRVLIYRRWAMNRL